ncbi:MAG: hypothetical protein NTY53_19070, partial [Kiritimatiellaeota bacterium]|nr:hypothetical protein [Kiritimatiellota bacterium]
MNENVLVPPDAGFKDRRTGLMVFGILIIIIGCFLALMVPLMLFGQLMAKHVQGVESTPPGMMVGAILMYVGMAAALIWLGVGSIQCRRWARALLLIGAWVGLIGVIIGIVMMAFILPQIFSGTMPGAPSGTPPMPAAFRVVFTVIMLAFCTLFYVIIPGALVLFYRSPHVKATCEARDPVPRWTDACPLPVLAVSLMLGCTAAMMPLVILCYHSVVPCFGTYLSGAPAAAILLGMAAAYAFAARANYRLNIIGWWIAILGFGLGMLSAVVTFARVGLLPMYELMEFPKAQLDMMRQMGFLQSPV